METLLIPIEYRADETRESPGRLTGVLMAYGSRARNLPELFEQDSLHWRDDGIVIRELHPQRDAQGRPINSTPPIMRAVPFLEGRELRIDAPLPNTTKGRDVAESMRGPLPLYGGLSVEFAPEKETRQGGIRRISRALLDGAALVLRGEYADSTVEVREGAGLDRRPEATLWL